MPSIGSCFISSLPTFVPVIHFTEPAGTEEEMASLAKSYEHLCKMRDEIVELGIVPAVEKWNELNPNL